MGIGQHVINLWWSLENAFAFYLLCILCIPFPAWKKDSQVIKFCYPNPIVEPDVIFSDYAGMVYKWYNLVGPLQVFDELLQKTTNWYRYLGKVKNISIWDASNESKF